MLQLSHGTQESGSVNLKRAVRLFAQTKLHGEEVELAKEGVTLGIEVSGRKEGLPTVASFSISASLAPKEAKPIS